MAKERNKVDDLTALLQTGSRHATHWRFIADMLDLKSRREVYEVIAQAREDGFIIIPNNRGGYYLGDTTTDEGRAEVERFVKHGHSEAMSILTTIKSARVALNECKGQIEFE